MGSGVAFGAMFLVLWMIRATQSGTLAQYVGLFEQPLYTANPTANETPVGSTAGSSPTNISIPTASPTLAGAGSVGAGVANSDLTDTSTGGILMVATRLAASWQTNERTRGLQSTGAKRRVDVRRRLRVSGGRDRSRHRQQPVEQRQCDRYRGAFANLVSAALSGSTTSTVPAVSSGSSSPATNPLASVPAQIMNSVSSTAANNISNYASWATGGVL